MSIYNSALESFQDENGNVIPLPENFSYNQIIYTRYELFEYSGKTYIVGRVPILKESEKFDREGRYSLWQAQREKICSNADLLFSMLRLADLEDSGKLDTDRIISWSIKYGLPFESETLWSGPKVIGFDLIEFQLRVRELKLLFNWWEQDSYRESTIKTIASKAQIFVDADVVNGNFQYFLSASDLFSAAYLQLIMLISNKGNAIKRCDCCGHWFYPKRSNNIYCSDCSRQKAYKRRKSNERKGEVNG